MERERKCCYVRHEHVGSGHGRRRSPWEETALCPISAPCPFPCLYPLHFLEGAKLSAHGACVDRSWNEMTKLKHVI